MQIGPGRILLPDFNLHIMQIRLLFALLLLPFAGFSHGFWIEAEGSHKLKDPVTVKLYFGEYASGEKLSGKYLDRMKDIKVYVQVPGGAKQTVIMKQLNDYWEGTFTPEAEGIYQLTGINDEREVQDWTSHRLGITRPVQYLETSYQVGTTVTPTVPSSLLNVQLKETGGHYEIRVLKNGAPLASNEVTVALFGKKEKVLRTDKDGKISFHAETPGIYLVGVEWIDPTPGRFKDKAYETVRHKLDYSLYYTPQ